MRQTVLYPLASQIDYTELKYSLRSIEKYLTPPFDVVVVGDTIPEWINNVTQIELGDAKGRPNYSVRRKVLAGLEYVDEFLFMNDDIYLLQTSSFYFNYYSCGMLKTKGESGAKSLLKQLECLNKPGRYYGHYPANVYKSGFQTSIEGFTNEVPIKSAFINYYEFPSIEIADCKIMTAKKPEEIREFIKDKPCFSTGQYSIKSCIPILDELFSEPSIYEI
ncbi:MAG TPA: hypothetical protein VFF27_07725 [Bacteroidia bacterium]|nr:hypothetical protein [Bacteroidia bacterium]